VPGRSPPEEDCILSLAHSNHEHDRLQQALHEARELLTLAEQSAGIGIWLVNLLLGWTGIGWLAALLWACSSPVARATPVPATTPPAGGAQA